jgi:SAM-dependent methyltransferase
MAIAERFQGANVVDAGRLSPYWGEHAARYVYAKAFVEERSVLDIACGTGYGVGLLRSKARFVAGVDIDPAAARDARNECGGNAAVLLANGVGLPFADSVFDIITSFETLEHLYERRAFLLELARVLRTGGTLILSTPNANYSQPLNGKPANPFHIHEYTPDELVSEIESVFSISEFLGQTLNRDTGIPPFFDAQRRLPRDVTTQARLVGWRAFNKIPFPIREFLSAAIWGKPFYPTEMDYNFSSDTAANAPTLVAVCRKI